MRKLENKSLSAGDYKSILTLEAQRANGAPLVRSQLVKHPTNDQPDLLKQLMKVF